MNDKFYTKKEIEVKWTGSYPNLCSGSWIIKIDGVQLVDKNDDTEDLKDWRGNIRDFSYGHFMTENMGTSGSYNSWHFDENYSEVFTDYYEGGDYKNDWFKSPQGKKMLDLLKSNGFKLSKHDLNNLYNEISENDWRSGSCGGCI